MATMWMFPGQGSQRPGMGALVAQSSPAAREVYEVASRIVGYDMREMCAHGSAELLARTDICRPALLASCMAMWAADGSADAAALVTGHSLGEYAGLVAAGAIELAPALELVCERAARTLDAARTNPGAMLAILGAERGRVAEWCARVGGVWAANDNCPGKVVISGNRESIERIEREHAGRARMVRLAVEGAFHSPLMAPARAGFVPALAGAPFAEPVRGFLSPTLARFEADPRALRRMLADQLTGPVLFTDSIRVAAAAGVVRFIELGPRPVLGPLVRRILGADARVEHRTEERIIAGS